VSQLQLPDAFCKAQDSRMPFFKGDDGRDDGKITDALVALRKRLVKEITTEEIAATPKMVWKITSTFQCLIRRTIEAADGMRTAWNAGNLLTAITMGRSLIETGAIVRNLADGIKKAVETRDVDVLDEAVMHAGFATRDDAMLAERPEYKATNIITMVERMDKSLFGDKTPRLRGSYDFLSEFAHPNHFGILGLYSKTVASEYRVEFGNAAEKKHTILPNLRVTTSMIWLVELAAKDIDKLVPQIRTFVPK
jgi:hypothetical protein